MSIIDQTMNLFGHGPVTSLSLVPDRPGLTFHAGEVLSGHCIITVDGSLDLSKVEIKFTGKAQVIIEESRSSSHHGNNHHNSPNHPVRHVQKIKVIENVYNPATVYNSVMSTGRHDVGFSFMIPPNVPSSLDGQHGFIRYKLKGKAGGQKTKLLVNIISSPNVSPSELYLPLANSNHKTVGLFGGKPVDMRCDIPRTGHTLGAQIPINCNVSNQSKKKMTLKASLKQEISFKAGIHERKQTNKLTFANGPPIEPFSTTNHNLTLAVPLNLPIVHNTCSIISVRYVVSVKLDIPGSFDLHCILPIILTNQSLS